MKITILFIITVFFVFGCTASKYEKVTPEIRSKMNQDLENGNLVLDETDIGYAVDYDIKVDFIASLHNNNRWAELAELIMKIGYEADITYYLLGVSAEGLGYFPAALKYYSRAIELYSSSNHRHTCRSIKGKCLGLDLSRVLPQRVASIKAKMDYVQRQHEAQAAARQTQEQQNAKSPSTRTVKKTPSTITSSTPSLASEPSNSSSPANAPGAPEALTPFKPDPIIPSKPSPSEQKTPEAVKVSIPSDKTPSPSSTTKSTPQTNDDGYSY